MRTTNKGMAQLRYAHYQATEFCRHGKGNVTKNVTGVYIEAIQIEIVMTNSKMSRNIFLDWCDAQDRVFQAVIRLGYGMHEVRTGK